MNDHNLDDLIIDNIDPKNSKTKSFLTIIALAIVVLIVAIILTKIILKDPNQKLILEEDTTELISPDLTLQSSTQKDPIKPKEAKSSLSLNTDKSKTEPKVTHTSSTTTSEVKPKTVTITNEFSQNPSAKKEKEAKLAAEKRAAELKAAAQAKKEREAKRLTEEKAKQQAPKVEHVVALTNAFFIQVGSFTQTPSSRFLSVIKNSGFNYNITPAANNGTKKLLIGPYASRSEVDAALVRVRDRINKSAFVIKK